MSDNAFGLYDQEAEETAEDERDPFLDEQPSPPEKAEEGATTEAEPAEEEGQAEQTAPETEQQPEPMYAGRFPRSEEGLKQFERSYKELQTAFQQAREEGLENGSRVAQMEMALAQLGPVLKELQQRTMPEEEREQNELAEYIQNIINQSVEARVAPLQYQQQQERAQGAEQAAIAAFAAAHTDIEPNSAEDIELQKFVQATSIDRTNLESLEIALEAVRDPALRMVLEDRPHLIDTDESLEYARAQAKLLAPQLGLAPGTQGTGTGAAQQGQAGARRQAAHVETGGTGAPSQAPGTKKGDEMDEAMASWKEGRRASVIFGS